MGLIERLANVASAAANNSEAFSSHDPSMASNLSDLIVLVVVIGLWLFIGVLLWNNVACKLLTICKPTDLLHLLGLMVLVNMLVC
jgi:hypothetical protein